MDGRSGPDGVAAAFSDVRARFREMPQPVTIVKEAAE
jgi:N-methylhydantoinase B